jgi:hypothetical protein
MELQLSELAEAVGLYLLAMVAAEAVGKVA